MPVKHAHKDKALLMVHADFQDQFVDVTKSITNKPTHVFNANLDNSQETVESTADNKILDAELSLKLATPEAKYNLDNNNAMHVQHVPEDKDSLEMFAKHQDQSVIASKNMIN
jgi:hypothetical protein